MMFVRNAYSKERIIVIIVITHDTPSIKFEPTGIPAQQLLNRIYLNNLAGTSIACYGTWTNSCCRK